MKTRLDIYLLDNGYFQTREKAKAAIMAGVVFVNGQISDKAGNLIKEDDIVEVKGSNCPYVSRGGFKLEKALDVFKIELSDKVCLDIGASTAGFTDCMLQIGAKKVYAVDVGYGQLDYKLRNDSRVINIEKCNFRYIDFELIKDEIQFACTDVSFISLKHIFPNAAALLNDNAYFVCLVKPQFEAGREQVGKNGIIKDPLVHKEVISNVINYARENSLQAIDLNYSPIKGAKGNIEFLLLLQKKSELEESSIDIDSVVSAAHCMEV